MAAGATLCLDGRVTWHAWLRTAALLVLVILLLGDTVRADDHDPGATPAPGSGAQPGAAAPAARTHAPPSVEQRLHALEAQPDAGHAAGPALHHARLALERAGARRRAGRTKAAERARRIAEAAVLLADRELSAWHERQAMREALARATRATARAQRARDELEAALRRRAAATDAGVAGGDGGTPDAAASSQVDGRGGSHPPSAGSHPPNRPPHEAGAVQANGRDGGEEGE